MIFPEQDQQTYARRRYQQTRQHYLLTNQGHVWLDCPDNRAIFWEGLEIVWTTRQA
jgi:hypothetical protein